MPPHRTLLIALALAALPASSAQGSPERPQPCAGLQLSDPAGDARYNPLGTAGELTGAGTEPAPPSLDVLSAFLLHRAGTLTVNIAVADLARELPGGIGATGGSWYYAYWVYDGRVRFVRAANTGSGDILYRYGYVTSAEHGGDPVSGLYQTEGDTTGAFAEGPEGVVSITVPPEIGGVAGAMLAGFGVSAETIEGQDDFMGVNHVADSAPDELDVVDPQGPAAFVRECPTNEVQRSEAGAPALPPLPAEPPPAPAARPRALPLSAPGTQRISRHVRVTAREPMTAVKLVLRRGSGGRAVASGSARRLKAGRARVRLRPGRRLRAGRYVIEASGVVGGRRLARTLSLRVRR